MNILADRLAVPEFLQENCTPANLTAALRQLLTSPEARDTNRKDLAPRVLFILNNLVLALCNAVSPPQPERWNTFRTNSNASKQLMTHSTDPR